MSKCFVIDAIECFDGWHFRFDRPWSKLERFAARRLYWRPL